MEIIFVGITSEDESPSQPIIKELLERRPQHKIEAEGEPGDTILLPVRASDGEWYYYKYIIS